MAKIELLDNIFHCFDNIFAGCYRQLFDNYLFVKYMNFYQAHFDV